MDSGQHDQGINGYQPSRLAPVYNSDNGGGQDMIWWKEGPLWNEANSTRPFGLSEQWDRLALHSFHCLQNDSKAWDGYIARVCSRWGYNSRQVQALHSKSALLLNILDYF